MKRVHEVQIDERHVRGLDAERVRRAHDTGAIPSRAAVLRELLDAHLPATDTTPSGANGRA